jgi:hypothetical protein
MAGILTLMSGIVCLVATLAVFVLCCIGLRTWPRAQYAGLTQHMWRLSSIAALFVSGAIMYWVCAHLVIHHLDAGAILGVSWILFLVSLGLDIVNVMFFRRAVSFVRDPTNSQLQVEAGFLPYVQLNPPPAPMQQYRQPLVGAVAYAEGPDPSYRHQPYSEISQQPYNLLTSDRP